MERGSLRSRRPRLRALAVALLGLSLSTVTAAAALRIESSNKVGAMALAEELLASPRLPTPTTEVGSAPSPLLRQPFQLIDAETEAELHSFWILALPLPAFQTYVKSHPPSGVTQDGSGSGTSGGSSEHEITWAPRRPPSGISTAQLLYTFTALGRGRTGLRVDAEVVWLPERTAATLIPTTDRSATISLTSLAPRVGRRSLTLGPGRELRSLISLVNRLPTIPPPGPLSCALVTTSAKLSFRPRARALSNAGSTQEIGCASTRLRVGSREILLAQGRLVSWELEHLHLVSADLYGSGS